MEVRNYIAHYETNYRLTAQYGATSKNALFQKLENSFKKIKCYNVGTWDGFFHAEILECESRLSC